MSALGASYLGAPHRYRIEWTSTSVVWLIDGTIVRTAPSAPAVTMRPGASDFTAGGACPPHRLDTDDAVRVPRHVRFAHLGRRWARAGDVTWTNALPAGTAAAISVRTGNTPLPDGTWTGFQAIGSSGSAIGATSRYLQYKADLSTSDPSQTPQLQDVTITCGPALDTTPPTSVITFPVNGSSYNTAGWTGSITGTASDNPGGSGVASVAVSIKRNSDNFYWNGTSFVSGTEVFNAATGTTSWTYAFASSNLTTGVSYTVRSQATDALSNVETAPPSATFTYDTTAPDTTIDTTPSNPTNQTTAAFTFHSSEAGSTFECQLDTGGFRLGTSPASHNSLDDGSHTFQVRASDAGGNTDQSPASYTWVVDTTAPDTVIDTAPPALTIATSASFTFHSTEAGSSFQCQLDTGSFASCTVRPPTTA